MPARRTAVGQDELSKALAALRDSAGISGVEAARLVGSGFSQSKISRWESGRLVPDPADVERYARALGAGKDLRRWLVDKAHDLTDQHKASTPTRITLRRTSDYQRRVGRIEADAAHITTFHPFVVPGLLQTVEYMRALFASHDLPPAATEAAIKARIERQELLRDGGHRFTMILPDGAIGWAVGGPHIMCAQLENIVKLSELSNVEIGVIPWGSQMTGFPASGFDMHDERLVIVGALDGAAHITDPRDVARYVALIRKLRSSAIFGQDARLHLDELADRYRLRADLTSDS